MVYAVLEEDLGTAHHAQYTEGAEDETVYQRPQALQQSERFAKRFRYLHHRRELSVAGGSDYLQEINEQYPVCFLT